MAATAAQIAQLRRRCDETGSATYSDATLAEYIEARPLIDERGERPYSWDTTTTPPTQVANDVWIPTYDLAAAAAAVWDEKAAILAQDYDVKADGADLSRAQAYEQAMKQARHWQSRRAAGTITLTTHPVPVPQDSAA